jgi:hypothetical protein
MLPVMTLWLVNLLGILIGQKCCHWQLCAGTSFVMLLLRLLLRLLPLLLLGQLLCMDCRIRASNWIAAGGGPTVFGRSLQQGAGSLVRQLFHPRYLGQPRLCDKQDICGQPDTYETEA